MTLATWTCPKCGAICTALAGSSSVWHLCPKDMRIRRMRRVEKDEEGG